MTNFRFCRVSSRARAIIIVSDQRIIGGGGSGCGGKRTILHSNTGSIFSMILIAHFCLIIIIAPLDPFSLRFSNFQKMTTKKPKEKNAALGFILALVVWIIFFRQ